VGTLAGHSLEGHVISARSLQRLTARVPRDKLVNAGQLALEILSRSSPIQSHCLFSVQERNR